MKKPILIMRCYNNWNLTKAAIDSIMQKTKPKGKNYDGFKLVVVNDGSTDETREELEKYAMATTSIIIMHHETRKGSSAAINTALEREWNELDKNSRVFILDNDIEIITSCWLDDMLEYFKLPNMGAVGATSDMVSRQQNISNPLKNWNMTWLVSFCCAIRGDVIKKVGLFDLQFGPGNCEDTDYGIRIMEEGYKMVVAKDVFIKHHCHATFKLIGDVQELIRENNAKLQCKYGERKLQKLFGGQ